MSAHKRIVLIAILALGLALRSYHYFREPSMWHDEAAVVVNVLSRGYADLLGPLTFHEAAPPLFLWLEKAVCVVLGDGVFALRLPAFLAIAPMRPGSHETIGAKLRASTESAANSPGRVSTNRMKLRNSRSENGRL